VTLDQVCAIARIELENFEALVFSSRTEQVQPIQETCTAKSGDPLTEEKVRFTILRVLRRLADLPKGTRTTTSPQLMNIGGVEERVVHKGNVALTVRLQFDTSTLEANLVVGGYIFDEMQPAEP
jgi:hypothetical protein